MMEGQTISGNWLLNPEPHAPDSGSSIPAETMAYRHMDASLEESDWGVVNDANDRPVIAKF